MRIGLVIFLIGFTSGIAFRSFFDLGDSFAVFLILLGSALGFFVLKAGASGKTYFLVGLFVVSLGLGVARIDVAENPSRKHALDAYLDREMTLEGIIVDEPDVRASHTKLTIAVEKVSTREDEFSINTKIRVIAAHYPEFRYGDSVLLRGATQKPDSFIEDEDGGRPFRYSAYLAKDGIFYESFYPKIELLERGGGSALKRGLLSFKRGFLTRIAKVIPEPHAALAGGITMGTKEALGDDLLEMFRKTGIIHIVVLSGYNITIVAEAVGRAAAFLPRFFGLGVSALFIVSFAVMTGAGATVARASLMALLVLVARATGRVYEVTIALFIAGFFMLLHNPYVLVFDPSFQLSFLATFGLLFLAPRVEKFFKWLPSRFGIREVAAATIATQLFVLPLLIYMMGELSIVSFAVNLLILPLMPLAMLFVFLTASFGFVHYIASLPFAYITYSLLAYDLKVVEFFAGLPFASLSIPNVSAWFLVAIYAPAIVYLFLKKSTPTDAGV